MVYLTAARDAPATTMRKRKRELFDEDTGEVTTVQTTKQVKRNHQKTGKWHKEPTEAELRLWERDEKRQAAVDKALKREENKKINAVKRAEKEEKEAEVKRKEFEAGRMTFTQTLAKKPEDQLNLHSWFGGRPKAAKEQVRSRLVTSRNSEKSVEVNKEAQTEDGVASVADSGKQIEVVKQLSSLRRHDAVDGVIPVNELESSFFSLPATPSKMAATSMDLQRDLETCELSQDFDIAEDSDADTEILEELAEELEQQLEPVFKIPALPKRLPLSPMSKSDVNVRASQTVQVSSFKGKLEKASVTMPPSTQVVRNLLADICTQDLADDMDDADDEAITENKENAGPQSSDHEHLKKSFKQDESRCKPEAVQVNQSFTSIADSCDYDTIFAELGDTDTPMEMNDDDNHADEFDSELMDADLPATQLLSSVRFQRPASFTKKNDQNIHHKTANTEESQQSTEAGSSKLPLPNPTRKPLKKNDSFAIEGLSDDDLVEAAFQYEKTEQTPGRPGSAASHLTFGSTGSSLRKKRTLPWQRPGYVAPADSTQPEPQPEPTQEDEEVESSCEKADWIFG